MITNKKLIIKINATVLVVVFILFAICSCSSVMKKDGIRGVKITSTFPFIDGKGKLVYYDTSVVKIYYYQDKIIYNSSYHFNYTPENFMIRADEIRYYFFVYTKGMQHGLLFDKHKSAFGIKVLADSMVKKEWCNNIDIYSNFKKSEVNEIYHTQNEDSGTISKMYNFKLKTDTAFNGTVLYGFTNKMKNIPYSFSKELDSLNNMKLYKVNIVNNSRYIKEYNLQLERMEEMYSIENIPILNSKELMQFFEYDRKQNALLK